MRATFSVLAVAMLMLALGACGDDDSSDGGASTQTPEQKAQATVCDARADIGTQVDELTSLTAATVTKDAVTQSVDAIKKDLSDMSSAQADLSSERRSEAEAAGKAFASSVNEIAGQVLTSLSASDAKTALVTALQQLKTAYQTAFEPLDCS
jgi:hypothetical protein